MPIQTVKVDADGNVTVSGMAIPAEFLTELEPIDATNRAVKLADGRVQFKAKPKGSEVETDYIVALTVTRAPIDANETAQIAVKAEAQKARKAEAERKETDERERSLKRAEQSGRDGVMAVMGQVATIAQAAGTLSAMLGKAHDGK